MSLKDDPQHRLLDAAGQVFADKGFEGASVREICQRAEVNIAAVNYYFRDKERLYIEAVKSACRQQEESVPLPAWTPGTPARQKLRDFIHTLARRMLDRNHSATWQRQLIMRELAQPTEACTEWVRDHIRPSCEVLSGILAELLPDMPEGKRRLSAFSIVGQIVFHSLARPIVALLAGAEEYRTYDPALLAEHITEFSLNALGLGGGGRKPAGRRRHSKS
jgi:AcrR family transcriptional regulator